MKRTRHVMLRLTPDEYEAVVAAKPADEDIAVFVRKTLLEGVGGPGPADTLRRAAAFVVAALSSEIGYEEALALFDDHVTSIKTEVPDGGRD